MIKKGTKLGGGYTYRGMTTGHMSFGGKQIQNLPKPRTREIPKERRCWAENKDPQTACNNYALIGQHLCYAHQKQLEREMKEHKITLKRLP